MKRFARSFGLETRGAAHRRAAVASILALAAGCTGRLAVSDSGIDAGGSGGSSGATGNDNGGSGSNPTDAGQTPGSCQDGIPSGAESDIDCGGPDCPGCAPLSACVEHTDCQSRSCRAGFCRAPACDDGVRNGAETSVDCGGPSCMRCASKTCNCAISPELTALECDETDGPIFPGSQPMITPDGAAAVFFMCHSSVVVPGTPVCSTFRWTGAGSEKLADLGAYGMSRDGLAVLLDDGGSANLLRIDGGTTPVPLYFPMLLSADGTKLVNTHVLESNSLVLQRWSEAEGVETLVELAAPGTYLGTSQVTAVNSDGSNIVGFVETEAGDRPFLWTEARGLETLGPIPEDALGARPAALSEDGSVVVGITTTYAVQSVSVFRWTPDGFQTLAPAQGQYQGVSNLASPAFGAVTSDGSTLAATIAYPDAGSLAAWRFSTTDGATILSTQSPGAVLGMTSDGSTFIGTDGPERIKWVAQPPVADQPRQFSAVRFSTALEQSGVDLTGWELGDPTGVSDDGRVIFGRATCGGVSTLYRWVMEP